LIVLVGCVHYRQRLPCRFRASGDLGPDLECGAIERQDAPGEALLHLPQPSGKLLAAGRVGGAQFEDALFNLPQADDTDEQAGFILFIQPGDDLWRGRFPDVFGKRAGG
jgi:hypothetical protein